MAAPDPGLPARGDGVTDPITLLLGDCIERMRELPDESVDAVVTDPPYGLEFMGKEWDRLEGVGHSNVPLIAEPDSSNVFGRTGRISHKRSNNRQCATCGHWEWSGTPCRCEGGTTAIACQLEGFRCIGIEKEPEYMAIAQARLNGRQVGLGLDVEAPTRKRSGMDNDVGRRARQGRKPRAGEGWHF